MLHITIIGMGLLGTSLGMALRSVRDDEAQLGPTTITGYDRDARMTSAARDRLAIDRQARTIEDALREAQLVVVAVPAQSVREVFEAVGRLAPHGAVITDVTSTKAQVVEWARELLPRTVEFIGGHPMAGKEQSGPAAGDGTLFKGAIYCLTPLAHTRQDAIDLVEQMVRQAGAKPYYIDPFEHDTYVGGISHLPFLLSTGLVEVTTGGAGWREMSALAASGFRDISRLASGDAEMHRDICLTNAEALQRWIDDMIGWLYDLRDQIETKDADKLLAMFQHAREARDEWMNSNPNQRPTEDDFRNIGAVPERRGLLGRLGGPRPPEPRR